MSDTAKVCAAVTIAHVDGQVVLVAEPRDREVPQLVAVLSPREAHHLRSRLHKCANDAAAEAAKIGGAR